MKGVSVIIACYKAGDYLREAVESVHAVAPKLPYEIIIVDDHSRDLATRIALTGLHMTDPKVRIVEQRSNQGQSAARNRAIEMAKFDYILPLDADDKLNPKYPGYLEKSVRLLEDYPEVVLTYSKCRFIGARQGPSINMNYDEDKLLLRNMIPVYGVFRRAEALEAGGYRSDLRYAEDWEFWVHLHQERFKAGEPRLVHRFREAHYLYRQHETGQNVSVKQQVPMSKFYEEMTRRNADIYLDHFGTTDPTELCQLRRAISSPRQMEIERLQSATLREMIELAWRKAQRMILPAAKDTHPAQQPAAQDRPAPQIVG